MNMDSMELLQREIDGVNSDAESARANQLMDTDPALRTAYEELRSVEKAFASLKIVEPDPALRDRILSALPTAPPIPVQTVRVSFWETVRDRLRAPAPATLAYAFVLGVLLTFAITAVLVPMGDAADKGAVFGTIGTTGTTGSESPMFSGSVEHPFTMEGLTGLVRTGRLGSWPALEIRWSAGSVVTGILSFDGDRVSVRSIATIDGKDTGFGVSNATVELSGRTNVHYLISFEPGSDNMGAFDASLVLDGTSVWEQHAEVSN